jgi:hypothetical protein
MYYKSKKIVLIINKRKKKEKDERIHPASSGSRGWMDVCWGRLISTKDNGPLRLALRAREGAVDVAVIIPIAVFIKRIHLASSGSRGWMWALGHRRGVYVVVVTCFTRG